MILNYANVCIRYLIYSATICIQIPTIVTIFKLHLFHDISTKVINLFGKNSKNFEYLRNLLIKSVKMQEDTPKIRLFPAI